MATVPVPLALWGWVFMASFLATGVFLWLAGLGYRRLPRGTYWSERARMLFLPRIAFAFMVIWVPLGEVMFLRDDWPMGKWASLGLGLTGWLGCLLGEWAGMAGLNLPPAARTPRLGARVARVLILMPGVVVMLVLMYANTGRRLDWITGMGTLLVCVLLLGWQCGWCVTVCRWCGVMRPVKPEIRAVVDGISSKLGIPVREVFELELGMWNAFALIWTHSLAFTTGLLGGLNRVELEAVTAHELGHLAEGPRMRRIRMLGIIPLGVLGLFPGLVTSFGLVTGLLVMVAAFWGSRFLGKWVRRAEVDADAVAHGTELYLGCYALTLEKIYEANLVPAVLAQRTTHPDLYDRMVKAGVTPDFATPRPARKFPGVILALLATALAVMIVKQAMPEPPSKNHGREAEPSMKRSQEGDEIR